MSDVEYAKVCVTCTNREKCKWNNGKILTCEDYLVDKDYQPKGEADNE